MTYFGIQFFTMKRHSFSIAILLIIICGLSEPSFSQVNGFNKIRWKNEKIAPGLKWKSTHTILNDTVPQNINILIVDLNKRRIGISYNPLKNIPLSKQVSGTDALAAVNGGFFNIRDGGSVTYIRTSGRISDIDTAGKWSRNSNITGSLMIRSGKEVYIESALPNSWYDNHPEYEDVLLTGPLIIKDRIRIPVPKTPLAENIHPRTAIGTRDHRKVILVTLDGRTSEAFGMTISELASLMILLKCRDAVNLDGGGSTTMWISGKPFNGVVNMPCDNKKFDHEGERASSDAIVIR